MKVLFVDDERNIRDLVALILNGEGYEAVLAADGVEALKIFESERPDLVILDVMMPRLTGFEVCERMRAVRPDVPVVFLSAKDDIVDKKTGYKAGADDYMSKPFNGDELLLHVGALLRRCGLAGSRRAGVQSEAFSVGPFEFNIDQFALFKGGERVNLAPKEFQILTLLARHRGEVFSREEIVETIWGSEYLDAPVNIAVYVRHIREKIEDDPSHPKYLQTIRHVGYRFA